MPNQYRSGHKFRDISVIDAKLAELEQEKQHLIALRKKLQKPKPTPPVSDSFSSEQKIAIFRGLFRGRTDIFANRWQNQQGRSGYSVACNNEWLQGVCNKPRIKCPECNHRQFSELSDQVIYRHLAGQQVVGLYPLRTDNTCYFLAADFDKGSWQDEVKAISRACAAYCVPHSVDNVHKDRHPIVLTERREHAGKINNLLNESGTDSVILKGAMRAAERKRVDEHLHSAQVVGRHWKICGRGF